eukprot:TRINITY_DN12804_c0_g1_i1.p1 TRINITY_DN12804_c0_g1~~TRINITY_DN12804_c0_g1_i1.p1  ORF type:complete len:403 (-),score=88.17 TRINITY_DN12804_c0_g1_i1:912-2120(-)
MIHCLPDELFEHVASFLPRLDVARLQCVDHHCRSVIKNTQHELNFSTFKKMPSRRQSNIAAMFPLLQRVKFANLALDFNDEDMKTLAAGCPKLNHVEVVPMESDITLRCLVSNDGVKALARACPQLVTLVLHGRSMVSNKGLRELAAFCPLLEELVLLDSTSADITDKGLQALCSGCPALKRLVINNVSITTCAPLALCSQLQSLTLFSRHLTYDGFAALAQCPQLQELHVQGCPISDESLTAVCVACTKLVTLDVRQCTRLTDEFAPFLPASLRRLWIGLCKRLTDDTLRAAATNCPNLTDIDMWRLRISDDALQMLAAGCANLERLVISGCPVTDTGVGYLSTLPNLQMVDMFRCMQVTSEGVTQLQTECKQLRRLRGHAGVRAFGTGITSGVASQVAVQ